MELVEMVVKVTDGAERTRAIVVKEGRFLGPRGGELFVKRFNRELRTEEFRPAEMSDIGNSSRVFEKIPGFDPVTGKQPVFVSVNNWDWMRLDTLTEEPNRNKSGNNGNEATYADEKRGVAGRVLGAVKITAQQLFGMTPSQEFARKTAEHVLTVPEKKKTSQQRHDW